MGLLAPEALCLAEYHFLPAPTHDGPPSVHVPLVFLRASKFLPLVGTSTISDQGHLNDLVS